MFKPYKKEKFNYTLYGALFGFLFPLFATIIESINAYGSLTWANAFKVQSENVLIWIIDSAPFWLGLFARLGGARQDILLEQSSLIKRELNHTQEESFKALELQNQNFYGMLDNLPICFNLLAPDYSVPYANKMFRERFGHPEDKRCFELMYKGEKACEVCSPLKVFDDKEKRSSIWSSNDGRTYLTVCTPFIGSEGENLVMEMAMDITGQENSKLEAVKAKEEAEKANQAKSEFLARMSHELRTPMNAILGFTQLLQMDNKNPLVDYQMKNMERVSSAGHHLLTLINEILDLSKIESGLIDLTIERQDLVPIVNDVISLSMPLADEKGITLEYEELSESCFAEIDPLRFKQVVLNLISNAIKYNRPNGSVTLSYEKQKNGIMRLGVEDTGCGIPEENRDKLFQPFERLDMNRKNIEGVGIGLAISRKFIELMGGTIDFDSVEGKGSFFYIDIPISSKESDPVVF